MLLSRQVTLKKILVSEVIILVLAGALLYVGWKPLLSFVSRAAVVTGSVVGSADERAGLFFTSVDAYFSSRNAFEEEVRSLSEELAVARLAVIREEALKKENYEEAAFLRDEIKAITEK